MMTQTPTLLMKTVGLLCIQLLARDMLRQSGLTQIFKLLIKED
jgi:hypothetical protein